MAVQSLSLFPIGVMRFPAMGTDSRVFCINSGKLTKAQKKLVGTKDLAGRKRIRGKAIDRGCYEY